MIWWKSSNRKRHVLRFGARSVVGRIRSENEDAYGYFPQPPTNDNLKSTLFIVADGMGGHTRGGEASRTAVEVIRDVFPAESGSVVERLRAAFTAANTRIFERSRRGNPRSKSGTTCTALALADGRGYIAHVGDSRACRITPREVERLTRDHTVVDRLRRQQVLTESEARTHPRRHTLTRALGVAPEVEIDVEALGPLRSGDRFLLYTDGLSSVTDEEIRRIVISREPEEACEKLVDLANTRDGADNITVLVVYWGDAG